MSEKEKENISTKKTDKKENSSEKKESDDSKEEKESDDLKEEKENSKEKDEEELEEVIGEENYEKMTLNRFLSNPWKQVSLEERNFSPILSLEQDLSKKETPKKDLDEEKIEYQLFKGIEEGKYQSFSVDENFKKENFLSEQEKELDKMKRLYEVPKKLSREFEKEDNNSIKYVKPEDTKRTDYLLRKKFGEN
jgi:hypothetical protein